MPKEYIRTERGQIIKKSELKESLELKNIVDKSKKLIDLIEVDDYVNGYRVIRVDKENDLIYCDTKGYETLIHSKDIKEILTKEVYLDNCYKTEQK